MAILPDLLQAGLPVLLLLSGAGLIVAEAFAPGAHFFVVGVALFVAGLVGFVLPPFLGPLNLIILAGVVLVTGAATLYGYRELDVRGGPGEDQTSSSTDLRGQVGRVTERVTPREGEVKLDDGGFNPYYRARSVDGEIDAGEEVMVVDPGGGNVITVESTADLTDDIDRELARERKTRDEEPAGEVVESEAKAKAEPEPEPEGETETETEPGT
jgi:membrane protein implicated in regulation of membrane protease activity